MMLGRVLSRVVTSNSAGGVRKIPDFRSPRARRAQICKTLLRWPQSHRRNAYPTASLGIERERLLVRTVRVEFLTKTHCTPLEECALRTLLERPSRVVLVEVAPRRSVRGAKIALAAVNLSDDAGSDEEIGEGFVQEAAQVHKEVEDFERLGAGEAGSGGLLKPLSGGMDRIYTQ